MSKEFYFLLNGRRMRFIAFVNEWTLPTQNLCFNSQQTNLYNIFFEFFLANYRLTKEVNIHSITVLQQLISNKNVCLESNNCLRQAYTFTGVVLSGNCPAFENLMSYVSTYFWKIYLNTTCFINWNILYCLFIYFKGIYKGKL